MTLLSLFRMRLLVGRPSYIGKDTGPISMRHSERAESEFGLIVLIKLSIRGQLSMVDSIYFKFVARLVCWKMHVGCFVIFFSAQDVGHGFQESKLSFVTVTTVYHKTGLEEKAEHNSEGQFEF